jgi:hypothetical protein
MDDYQSALEEAIRRRLLEEVAGQRQAQIVNNLYASGAAPSSIREAMAPEFNPKDYEYFVNIEKKPIFDDENKEIGWKKLVRRYAQKAGAEGME